MFTKKGEYENEKIRGTTTYKKKTKSVKKSFDRNSKF